jgi:hypothetical protein
MWIRLCPSATRLERQATAVRAGPNSKHISRSKMNEMNLAVCQSYIRAFYSKTQPECRHLVLNSSETMTALLIDYYRQNCSLCIEIDEKEFCFAMFREGHRPYTIDSNGHSRWYVKYMGVSFEDSICPCCKT